MRREKFVFNPRTLKYDGLGRPLNFTLLKAFGFLCAAVLTGLVFTAVVHRYFPSPGERMLMQELEIAKAENEALATEYADLSEVVSHLHDRSNNTVRLALRMEPVDDDVFLGGKGGHDAYEDLRSFPNVGSEMADLRARVDQLRYQIDLHSRSIDEVADIALRKEDMLASIPSIKPIRDDQFTRKMENLSGFGFRIHPTLGVNKMHYGIDFNCRKGTEIQASGKGVVESAGQHAGYGNCVVIDHGYGFKSRYAHMSSIKVKKGQKVDRGHLLGLVGSTGQSTGDHLHYEIEKDGERVDPIQYCYDGLTTEEYRELVTASRQMNMSFDE
ncbi:murein DD-endopeptidase MepM/ murein hydrolase activator NlpD [Lewinella aquimaris]|uniref:Murein DD-endopeptidase MepM/ murein hydrolase activator NlpD n=1 Tax=Neolewinella aquimaris TaxID=1835722 RepID=A0A840E1T5_9BACT|nr:M23 family metallopeptidase [Neolewinella aquimaris]MBB4079060.1 murein DD-endopeptidase MepM/ murein hydrolase activator NlpD [Neolewinella aquimaris]